VQYLSPGLGCAAEGLGLAMVGSFARSSGGRRFALLQIDLGARTYSIEWALVVQAAPDEDVQTPAADRTQ
jgi:hypothetical protein